MPNNNHGEHASFQVKHSEILENDLEKVSGGKFCPFAGNSFYEICPFCQKVINQTLAEHENACTAKPWWGYSRG